MSLALKNFSEENNNIPYVEEIINIGDFLLEKNPNDKKIIEDAKVACNIYWIKNLEELNFANKKIIVVIPALTWTQKIFANTPSQWDWWANTYWKKWNILDPNKSIVIWLNYFWSLFNDNKEKHKLNFYPVPPEKQVEAWKKALEKLWLKKIDILFWGSNWWGHIHHWVLDKNKKLNPEILIPIAWPIAPSKKAKEFFKIQLDFLEENDSLENISSRLEKNLENLKWKSELFDELVKLTKNEILNYNKKEDENSKKIMKIVRQIWFLKFVWPKFFDRFWFDKEWIKLKNFEEARKNMMNYFEKEWVKFEKRFGKSYLKILLKWIVEAHKFSPKEYVRKISKEINLIIIWLKDDTLFEEENLKNYFEEVKNLREKNNHSWKTIFESISWENSEKAAHDYFLWEEWWQIISDKIKQILNWI